MSYTFDASDEPDEYEKNDALNPGEKKADFFTKKKQMEISRDLRSPIDFLPIYSHKNLIHYLQT